MSNAPKVTMDEIKASIVGETYTILPDQITTVCQLTLDNGFTVSGESACASPENFNLELGKQISKEKATSNIWPFLGFRLKDKLKVVTGIAPPQEAIAAMEGVKTYIGTKVIYAAPMNRGDYNTLRGWELLDNENGADEGYLVEYAEGGDTNAAGFSGYISWSPKAVFEKSYKTVDYIPPVPNYAERIKIELQELLVRHTRLVQFIQTDAYVALGFEEREMLEDQRGVMEQYASILSKRLGRAEANPGAV